MSHASSRRPRELILRTQKLDALRFGTQDVDSSECIPGDVAVFQRGNGFRCLEFAFLVSLLPLLVSQRACVKNQIGLFAGSIAGAEKARQAKDKGGWTNGPQ